MLRFAPATFRISCVLHGASAPAPSIFPARSLPIPSFICSVAFWLYNFYLSVLLAWNIGPWVFRCSQTSVRLLSKPLSWGSTRGNFSDDSGSKNKVAVIEPIHWGGGAENRLTLVDSRASGIDRQGWALCNLGRRTDSALWSTSTFAPVVAWLRAGQGDDSPNLRADPLQPRLRPEQPSWRSGIGTLWNGNLSLLGRQSSVCNAYHSVVVNGLVQRRLRIASVFLTGLHC